MSLKFHFLSNIKLFLHEGFLLATEQILISLEGNEVSKVEDAVFELVLSGNSWKVSCPRCLSNAAFLLKTYRESQLVALIFHFNV